jgi:prepilin-type N-terminal cleavage/methylation domain-containing protein
MDITRKNHPSRIRSSAFTLVELLVVIAIISILMTAGSIGLSGMGGKGVTSGVTTAEALFDEARTTAVGRNLRTAVLVAKKLTNNSADDLRRIVIAYEDVDVDGKPKEQNSNSPPKWVFSSRGLLLPDQTFFSSEFSKQQDGSKIPDVKSADLRSAPVTNKAVSKAYEGDYYIYEFNSQGICKTPGASFIIGSGARPLSKSADTNPPRVTGSAQRDFGGFVVWRNGRTSLFRSPTQMGSDVGSVKTGDKF